MLQQTTRPRTQGSGIRQSHASGLTLIEILSAVFVLSMGLILVAAAFPVGVKQSDLMRQDTETSIFAGEVLDMIRAHTPSRSMTADELTNVFKKDLSASFIRATETTASGNPGPTGFMKSYLVRNSNRSAYGLSVVYGPDDELLPVINGDWACHPFLTRLTSDTANNYAATQVPLYRVTMIMRRHDSSIEPVYRSIGVTAASPDKKTLTVASNRIAMIFPGDTVVDARTGFTYRIIAKNDTTFKVDLDRPLDKDYSSGMNIILVGPTASTYYALLSH